MLAHTVYPGQTIKSDYLCKKIIMFFQHPLTYCEPLFRPPGEARSAILQATIGCSWNKCAFCQMYTSKSFKVRSLDELKPEIMQLARFYGGRVKKVFLADGDAFVLSAHKLTPILQEINRQFGRLQRISAYAMPAHILSKSKDQLMELRSLGLKLLYIGIETGDDELLGMINKGETFSSTVEGIEKAHDAGIDTSIMIINGLAGKRYSEQHAVKSSEIITRLNPKFLSTLTLSLPMGEEHYRNQFKGHYQQQTVSELLQELRLFLQHIRGDNIIFRSNHVSNNLVLEGVLSKDQNKLLAQIDNAIAVMG